MGRTNGYRPTKETREEYEALRAELAQLKDSQWVKAGLIMERITSLLGHTYGPSRGRINPRACRFCHYYGHTKQFCPRRIALEEEHLQRMLDEDQKLRESVETAPPPPLVSPQIATFERLGLRYHIDPDLGPMLG